MEPVRRVHDRRAVGSPERGYGEPRHKPGHGRHNVEGVVAPPLKQAPEARECAGEVRGGERVPRPWGVPDVVVAVDNARPRLRGPGSESIDVVPRCSESEGGRRHEVAERDGDRCRV